MLSNLQSPLNKVVKDKRVNEIITRIQRAVVNSTPLVIANADVKYISKRFTEGILQGEKRLYDLAKLILNNFCAGSEIKIDLLVWGRCTNPFHDEIVKKRFPLEKGFAQMTEKGRTEFGSKFTPTCPKCSNKVPVIASFIQFFPLDPRSRDTLNFISTRVKTTANLSYKIADLVFGIDRMFKQDKRYGKFSQAVVDVYGMKLITSTKEDIFTISDWIGKHRKVKILDIKDYLGENRKRSGFEAYKFIVEYYKQMIELQCQTIRMYNEELYNTETSHQTYKEKQMAQRRKLGHEYIVLYEALNKLFADPDKISDMDYIELGFGRPNNEYSLKR